MNLSAQLRAWRKRRDETQVEAAASLGVPTKTYIDYEQGRRTPRGLALTTILAVIKKADRRVASNNRKAKRPRAQSRTRPARRTSARK
jgi:DNA-binding XRE family transcriptional regulator